MESLRGQKLNVISIGSAHVCSTMETAVVNREWEWESQFKDLVKARDEYYQWEQEQNHLYESQDPLCRWQILIVKVRGPDHSQDHRCLKCGYLFGSEHVQYIKWSLTEATILSIVNKRRKEHEQECDPQRRTYECY